MAAVITALAAGALLIVVQPAGSQDPPAADPSWEVVEAELAPEEAELLRLAVAELTPAEQSLYHKVLMSGGVAKRALLFEQFALRPAKVQADFARILYRLTAEERGQLLYHLSNILGSPIPKFINVVARYSPDEVVAKLREAQEIERKLSDLGQGKTDLEGDARLDAMAALMEQSEALAEFDQLSLPPPAVTNGTLIRLAAVPFQAEIYKSGASATPLSPREIAEEARFFRTNLQDYQRQHECGGVLIARQWVLTAAHCIRRPASGEFLATRRVRTGTDRLTEGGTGWKIAGAVIHSGYDPDQKVNDIALLKIEADATTRPDDAYRSRIALLASPTTSIPSGTEMIVTGFGVTGVSKSGEKYLDVTGLPKAASPALMQGDLVNVDISECNNHPEFRDSRFTVGHGQLCARGKSSGVDACQGDSGGPVSALINGRRVVLGLVSYGIGCGMNNTPGVYVDLRQYRGWINVAKLKAVDGKVMCWSKVGAPAVPARLTRPVSDPCPTN